MWTGLGDERREVYKMGEDMRRRVEGGGWRVEGRRARLWIQWGSVLGLVVDRDGGWLRRCSEAEDSLPVHCHIQMDD